MRSAMHGPLAATGPAHGIVSRRGARALRSASMHPTRSQLPAEVVHRVEEARHIAAGPGVLHEIAAQEVAIAELEIRMGAEVEIDDEVEFVADVVARRPGRAATAYV